MAMSGSIVVSVFFGGVFAMSLGDMMVLDAVSPLVEPAELVDVEVVVEEVAELALPPELVEVVDGASGYSVLGPGTGMGILGGK
jgi:hypothetical protein